MDELSAIGSGRELLLIPPPVDMDDAINSREMASALDSAMDNLTARQREMVRLRFGIEDGREWTLEAIAGKHRLSKDRVRQIIEKALRRLMHPSVSISLKPFAPPHE